MKIMKTYLIAAILLMLCLNIAYAQWGGLYSYGKLKSVTATGNGPDGNGRMEYTIILEGTDPPIPPILMWMTPTQAAFLKHDIGKWISLYYTADAQQRNIYSHHYTHTPGGIDNEDPNVNELKHRHGEAYPPVPIDPNW